MENLSNPQKSRLEKFKKMGYSGDPLKEHTGQQMIVPPSKADIFNKIEQIRKGFRKDEMKAYSRAASPNKGFQGIPEPKNKNKAPVSDEYKVQLNNLPKPNTPDNREAKNLENMLIGKNRGTRGSDFISNPNTSNYDTGLEHSDSYGPNFNPKALLQKKYGSNLNQMQQNNYQQQPSSQQQLMTNQYPYNQPQQPQQQNPIAYPGQEQPVINYYHIQEMIETSAQNILENLFSEYMNKVKQDKYGIKFYDEDRKIVTYKGSYYQLKKLNVKR